MIENATSQVHKLQETWKSLVDEQTTRMASLYDEVAKAEAKRLEQTAQAVDELARLTKDSLGYFTRLSTEWQKVGLEATKRASELFTPGG